MLFVWKGRQDTDKRYIVFALTRQRFITWCRQVGMHPFAKNISAITTGEACRGRRLEPGVDEVIVLCDFWMHKHYDDIRTAFAPCGVDIEAIPVTFT